MVVKLVKKSDCTFSIIKHLRIHTLTNCLYQIECRHNVFDKFILTNALVSFRSIHNLTSFDCSKSFHKYEAQEFIFKLPDEFEIMI